MGTRASGLHLRLCCSQVHLGDGHHMGARQQGGVVHAQLLTHAQVVVCTQQGARGWDRLIGDSPIARPWEQMCRLQLGS